LEQIPVSGSQKSVVQTSPSSQVLVAKMHSVLTSLQLSSVHGFSSSHTISTASHSPLVLSHQLFQHGSSGAQVTGA
jgi:hypothetical protein